MTEAPQEIETKSVADVWSGFFAWILARLLLIVLLLFPFMLGGLVGGAGLHDPDTCWLLSLGRYIFEHRALPSTDPFSYTFAMQAGKPFVMYQWLTELAFFLAYKISGLPSLLMFCALVLGQSFLVFPFRLLARKAPVSIAAVLTIIGVVASCFHYLARPEISSYICMAVCLLLLQRIYTRGLEKVQWTSVAAMSVLMLIWTNAHSAFVLGLTLQIAFVVVTFVQNAIARKPIDGSLKTGALALAGSLLMSLLTPYGIGLWAYLPSLFFAKFNYRIDELRPIKISDLKDFTYWPFLILCLSCLCIFARALRAMKQERFTICWSNVVVIVIAAYYGFACRRIIPFSVLMMISLIGNLWVRHADSERASMQSTFSQFLSRIEKQFAHLMDPQSYIWVVTVAGLSLFGSFFVSSKVAAPTLPQGSLAFVTPIKAIDFLKANSPKGNCFNDAQFGDMLIWYFPQMPVFIDTRYDMHGESTVSDYTTMIRGDANWRELFEHYKVRWVFLPPNAEVLEKLKNESNWKTLFKDNSAWVLVRND